MVTREGLSPDLMRIFLIFIPIPVIPLYFAKVIDPFRVSVEVAI
jgi:hypothetical protein